MLDDLHGCQVGGDGYNRRIHRDDGKESTRQYPMDKESFAQQLEATCQSQHNGVKQKELYEGKVAGKHIDAVSSPEISAKSNFQIYSAVRHENDNTKIMKELGNMVSKDGEYCDLGSHWWLKLLQLDFAYCVFVVIWLLFVHMYL